MTTYVRCFLLITPWGKREKVKVRWEIQANTKQHHIYVG